MPKLVAIHLTAGDVLREMTDPSWQTAVRGSRHRSRNSGAQLDRCNDAAVARV